MRNIDIDAAKELRIIKAKKYWRRIGQVEIKFDWLHDWILTLAKIVKYL